MHITSPGYDIRQANVYTRRHKHRRNDDHKVLHHEVRYAVRVAPRGEHPEGVARDFHGACYDEGEEGPVAVEDELDEVGEEGEREEDGGEDAEGEVGGVAFDECELVIWDNGLGTEVGEFTRI